MTQAKAKVISASGLKWIAIICMFFDHFAWSMISEGYCIVHCSFPHNLCVCAQIFHILGRIPFPIFCFFIAEGFLHTRNVWKYALRLLLFGFLSEIPFDYAFRRVWFSTEWQNVYFTLFLGLAVLIEWDYFTQGAFLTCCWWRKAVSILGLIIGTYLGFRLRTDYYGYGVLLIFIMYIFRDHWLLRDIASIILLYMHAKHELYAIPAVLLLHLYNGKRGRQSKFFFYLFYPGHLAILCLARFLLYGL